MTWMFVGCSEQLDTGVSGDPQNNSPLRPADSLFTHQSELNYNSVNSIENPLTENHLYTVKIQQHVAKEAPSTIQEMAHKNATINTSSGNRPVKKAFFFPRSNTTFWQLRVQFQNDIFTNTDYYFTNGARIAFTSVLAHKGFYRLLVGQKKHLSVELVGFSITQNIYTPTNPDVTEVLAGDRPFSGYLTFGQFRETYNILDKIIIKSRLEMGVLGPASLGDQVQSSIHQIEPVGWDNQIRNMPVINYFFTIEKGIFNQPYAEINLTGSIAAGTAFNLVEPGIYFRTGRFLPVLKGEASLGQNSAIDRQVQYWFFVEAKSKFVVYDATLQGSMFNNNDPYVISTSEINRFVPHIQAGLALYYDKFGVECSAFYLAPEFKQARDFRWGSIRLIYNF
jgi:hypothetical protein